MLAVFAQVLAQTAAPVVPASPLPTIAAIVTGIVTVIGVLVTATLTILTALRQNAETGRMAGDQRDEKLTTLVDRTKNIEILVDGRYGDVLKELAELKLQFAEATGLAIDHEKAVVAQRRSDEQQTRVDKSLIK